MKEAGEALGQLRSGLSQLLHLKAGAASPGSTITELNSPQRPHCLTSLVGSFTIGTVPAAMARSAWARSSALVSGGPRRRSFIGGHYSDVRGRIPGDDRTARAREIAASEMADILSMKPPLPIAPGAFGPFRLAVVREVYIGRRARRKGIFRPGSVEGRAEPSRIR
jgi:hypothetical protein